MKWFKLSLFGMATILSLGLILIKFKKPEPLEIKYLASYGDQCPNTDKLRKRTGFVGDTCIPTIIHQTSPKTLKESPLMVQESAQSWQLINPNYTYNHYTDQDMEVFVYKHFSWMLDMWKQLLPIQKADVFRYLIIYKYGGVYADSDTIALVPVDYWIERKDNSSKCWETSQINTIVGLEGLTPTWKIWAQWTFVAFPSLPHFKYLIEKIYETWKINEKPIAHENYVETWKFTGPGIFTDAFEPYKENITILPKSIWGYRYDDWDLILPPLIMHRGAGSWKPTPHIIDQIIIWLWPK